VRLSADGKRLFYVSFYPNTQLSNLYVVDADGANPRRLLPGGDDWIIDSLAVAPDGESVVYSSLSSDSPLSKLSWLDKLMGVQVAQAHGGVPSDLWIVKDGQAPLQVTHFADYGFVEDFSPDGQFIVFSCSRGVYIMRPDGSGQTQIISEPVYSTLQWVP
jgi:Tol biopolymer transport system component